MIKQREYDERNRERNNERNKLAMRERRLKKKEQTAIA